MAEPARKMTARTMTPAMTRPARPRNVRQDGGSSPSLAPPTGRPLRSRGPRGPLPPPWVPAPSRGGRSAPPWRAPPMLSRLPAGVRWRRMGVGAPGSESSSPASCARGSASADSPSSSSPRARASRPPVQLPSRGWDSSSARRRSSSFLNSSNRSPMPMSLDRPPFTGSQRPRAGRRLMRRGPRGQLLSPAPQDRGRHARGWGRPGATHEVPVTYEPWAYEAGSRTAGRATTLQDRK